MSLSASSRLFPGASPCRQGRDASGPSTHMNAPASHFSRPAFHQFKPAGMEHTIKTQQVQIENISLMVALKENTRGRFLRVSEKNGERFACLMIPTDCLKQFNGAMIQLVRFNIKSDEIPAGRKKFALMLEEDPRGPMLGIIERNSNRAEKITIPQSGWDTFGKLMEEMARTSDAEPFPFNPVKQVNPVALASEKIIKSVLLQIENKSFMLLLKDNQRGRSLRLTEKTGQRFMCLYVPAAGMEPFKKMLEIICRISGQDAVPAISAGSQTPSDDRLLDSKQLQINEKTFDFVLRENARGKYLRLTESSPGFYPSSLVIPSTGLALLISHLDEMIQASNGNPRENGE
jgi:hypothetical protein